MKIVYLIAGLYRASGMERVLTQKANWLAEHGYEIVIVTTEQMGRPAAFPLHESIRTIDLAIGYEQNNGASLFNKLINYPAKQFKHKKRLTKVLKAEHADITICMFNNDASFVASIPDGSHKVLEVHFSRFKRLQYGRKGLWALADKIRCSNDLRIAKRYERFIVLTNEDSTYWGALPNLRVIPNPRTFKCKKPSDCKNKQIIAVGRYTAQKGFDMLTDAWNKVNAYGWTLRIAGDGPDKPSGPGIITGQSQDIKKELLGSSIFVLSSRYEGLPMALLEAQAAGLPAVCFECKCGPKDVVRDGVDGILVPEGDVEKLAAGIARLIEDEALRTRLGAEAYANSERYDIEKIMPLWEKLFAEL